MQPSPKILLSTSEVTSIEAVEVSDMMPGGRMNPKQMKAMMKRMGISQEDINDVEEVVIRTRSKEIFFKDAAVTAMTVQGQKTYQIVGTPQERPRRTDEQAKEEGGIPEEDI